ncbi:MAG: peptidoglycan-binding domain-containing protein [Cyanobacteria bacterium TGS_CYA1]|nr:peptidoglycan-binding domain-containing protein [Cyanobacteria bacterium TGS_CYA1]
MAKTLSGISWVGKFQGSDKLSTLKEPFKTNVTNFIQALKNAGASVVISSTLRSAERAYLMHYCDLIATGKISPDAVPSMDGVEIEWVHKDASGKMDKVKSKAAAQKMKAAYNIKKLAALNSNHIRGLAIDMTISWTGNLTITKADGKQTTISTAPKSGMNTTLHAVGKTYNVLKLLSDRPHWSFDGH